MRDLLSHAEWIKKKSGYLIHAVGSGNIEVICSSETGSDYLKESHRTCSGGVFLLKQGTYTWIFTMSRDANTMSCMTKAAEVLHVTVLLFSFTFTLTYGKL